MDAVAPATPRLTHTGIAPQGFSASLNRKRKQLLRKPPPPLGACGCFITFRAQNQPQPRLTERALHCWGCQRELPGTPGCRLGGTAPLGNAASPWVRVAFPAMYADALLMLRHFSFQLIDNPGGGRSKCSARGTGRLLQLGQPKSRM